MDLNELMMQTEINRMKIEVPNNDPYYEQQRQMELMRRQQKLNNYQIQNQLDDIKRLQIQQQYRNNYPH